MVDHNKHEVTVLDKKTYAANDRKLLPISVRLVDGDICNINSVEFLGNYLPFFNDFDWIIHFAAESHVDNAINDPTPFWKTNVHGTYELTKFAINHNIKFFHISTDEVFGEWRLGQRTFDEDTPYNPSNMYAVSKAASDQIVRAQHKAFGLQYIITNCGNNYGEFQHEEKFIPRVQKGHVTLHGDGKPIRDWIYVRDHCRAIATIIKSGKINQSFVIGSSDRHSIEEVAKMAGATYDFNGTRPGVDIGYALNPTKLERLGWKPRMTLKEWLDV